MQRIAVRRFEYTRAAGEVLHPARESEQILARTQRELGSANFNTQYQQAPEQIAGSVVKREWMVRYELLP